MTVSLLLMWGCASAPSTEPNQLAEKWIGPVESTIGENRSDLNTDWVRDFGEPTLTRLVEQTLRQNPDRVAASARLQAALSNVRIIGAERLPRANAQMRASRGRTVNRLDLPPFGETLQTRTASRYELGLNVSWELDIWGRLADERRAAESDAMASAADLGGIELALATSISRAWFQAIAAKKRTEIARGQLLAAEKSLKATEDRLKRGLIGGLELSLARSQAESSKSILENRTSQQEKAFRLVQSLSGDYPDGEMAVPQQLPSLKTPPPAFLPASLLERRPDLLSAARRIEAADSRVSAAEKRLIPALSLSGSLGTASEDLSDLLNQNFSVWNLAGNLMQPLFEGGRIRADIERREALLIESMAQFESDLITALREVENGLNSDAYLRNSTRYAETAAREADIAARQGFDRFLRGLIDLLDVLELQNRSFEAQLRQVDAQLEVLTNRIDLYAALGGGFLLPGDLKSTESTVQSSGTLSEMTHYPQ